MSKHSEKLERVLELLLSEGASGDFSSHEHETARDLLHQVIVDKARSIYESAMAEMDDVEDEDLDEAVGGDEKEDFVADIKSDEDDIEDDESAADDVEVEDDFEDDVESEEQTEEERISDLEDQLAELRAEFDALMSQELEEPEHDGLDDEFESEFGNEIGQADMPFDHEDEQEFKLGEATEFAKKSKDVGMKSEDGSVNKTSQFTKAPSKMNSPAKPVDFTKDGQGKALPKDAQEHCDDIDNMDVEPKKVSTPSMKEKPGVSKKSPLSSAPKK